MSKAEYALLQDVVMDADFPDLDLALRRGRHIDREDAAWYSLLTDAQELLEPFYRRYGCELIHKTDGYFYLLPTGDKVSRKQLAATDMLVGQALALLYLDPAAVERGGVVTQEEVVSQLSAVLGSDALIGVFSPGKRKAKDERIAQRNVRQRVGEAVRRLAVLGFVELSEENAVRLRAALLRFAEPVRGLSEPAEALAKLVAQGEVALAPDDAADGDDVDDAREGAEDEPDRTTLVGVPAPSELDVAGYRAPAAGGGGGSSVDVAPAVPHAGAAGLVAFAGEAPSNEDSGLDEAPFVLTGGSTGADAVEHASDASGAASADGTLALRSERADEVEHASDLGARADAAVERGFAPVGDLEPDDLEQRDAGEADESLGAAVVEALASERAERDLAELDVAHAQDDMADTLAGIGAPPLEADDDAAEGGVPERSAVVRKPRSAPVDAEDLDWADILVPEPEPDAEDGS